MTIYDDQVFNIVYPFNSTMISGVVCNMLLCEGPIFMINAFSFHIASIFNNLFLAYIRSDPSTNFIETYGIFLNSINGYPSGSEFKLHSAGSLSFNDSGPRISLFYDKCFIVSFKSISSTSSNVYAVILDPNGNVLIPTFQMTDGNPATYQFNNKIVVKPYSEDFLTIWESNETNLIEMKGQMFMRNPFPLEITTLEFTIGVGETVQITRQIINVIGSGTITILVNTALNGYFTISNARVDGFLQSDIDQARVSFVQDVPVVSVYCLNDRGESILGTNVYIYLNTGPRFINCNYKIEIDSTTIMTINNIYGVVFDGIIYANYSCHFELLSNPGVPISSFTNEQIKIWKLFSAQMLIVFPFFI